MRKGQIQMGETIAVLLVFFVLLLLGIMFYARVLRGNIELDVEESKQLKSIEIAQRASFLPELQCSEENIIRENCIDLLKLDAAAKVIQNNKVHYFDNLGFSNIMLREIYPREREWQLYENSLEEFSSKTSTNIPIALFDPRENKNYFGIMTVEVFSR